MKLYVIGSLRNAQVPLIAQQLRHALPGVEVFDDWFSPGPEADEFWKVYEQTRGRTYEEALKGYAGKHIFEFDKHHLDTSDAVVLVLPAGKSGHLEAGYMVGKGKPLYILLDDVERWDVMYEFATLVTKDVDAIARAITGKMVKDNRTGIVCDGIVWCRHEGLGATP